MGVKGLYKFIKINGLYEDINMCEVIKYDVDNRRSSRKQRKRRGPVRGKPTIVFDMLSLTYLFFGGNIGMLGGRHDISLNILKEFFIKLINAGAILIFFCDGQVSNDEVEEWCFRSNEKHIRSINSMKRGSAEDGHQFKCFLFWKRLRSLIKDNNFGEIKVCVEVDCDRAIAKYASDNRNNVLAVVSPDTDMLIFDGDFPVWNIKSIDSIKQCEAEHLDRDKLLRFLNLSRNEMKIFATIKGNDFTKRFGKDMKWLNGDTVRAVSDKTRTISRREFNGNLDKKIIAETMLRLRVAIEDEHVSEHVQSVEKSLHFYSLLDFESQQSSREINVLKYCFENGFPLQYDVQFIDFRTNFIHILLGNFQRIGGILQLQQPGNDRLNQLKIVTKCNKDENYQLIELTPISRNNEENENDIAWKDLLYSLGLRLDIEDLKTITQTKDHITMAILTGLVLLKANQITEREADLLLLMHCNKKFEELETPLICEYNTVRIVQAFFKAFTLVDDCYYICFKDYAKYAVYFDGVYYCDLMRQVHVGGERSELIECLDIETETIYNRLKQSVIQN